MTVFVATFVDQAFDKKSAEVAYISKVLRQMADQLQESQGTLSSSQNVLGCNEAGVANTTLASFTYTASATNP